MLFRRTLLLLSACLGIAAFAPACARASAESSHRPSAADAGEMVLTSAVIDAGFRRAPSESCPDGMILVDGEYCPNVEQTCLKYRDPPGGPYSYFRCDVYQKPAKCLGKRVHKR